MKRELIQNITAIPYTSGSAIDREGFLSAVVGVTAASGADVTVKVEHSDDGENFVAVTDTCAFPEKQTTGGEYTFKNEAVEGAEDASGVVNIDVDLVGLKNFVKFTITGAEDAAVVVLGDPAQAPV